MALAPLRAMVAAGRTSLALQTPRRSSDGSSAGSGSSSARMLWVWGLIAVMAVGMVLLLVVAVPVHTNSRLTHHILHHVCFTLLHPAAAARCCQMLFARVFSMQYFKTKLSVMYGYVFSCLCCSHFLQVATQPADALP
jgi:hypothetical protein